MVANGSSPTGFVKIFRRLRDHWVAECPRQLGVWVTLLMHASWTRKTVDVPGGQVDLEPGELHLVGRHFARKVLRVEHHWMRRFFEKLEDADMIGTRSLGRQGTVLRIVNWSEYQGESIEQAELPGVTKPTQNRNAENPAGRGLAPNGVTKPAQNRLKKSESTPPKPAPGGASPDASRAREEVRSKKTTTNNHSAGRKADGRAESADDVEIPRELTALEESGMLRDLLVAIRGTRKSNRIAASTWRKILDRLRRYPEGVAERAVATYVDGHWMEGKREEYLFGICEGELSRGTGTILPFNRKHPAGERAGTPPRKAAGPQGHRCLGCGEAFEPQELEDFLAHVWREHPEIARRFDYRKPKQEIQR